MTSNHAISTQLESLFDQELEQLEQLLNLLDREKHCVAKDVNELDKVVLAKQEAIQHLETLSTSQRKLLEQHGFSSDTAGMESCLQECSVSKNMIKKWTLLKDKLKQCREFNIRNGALVEASHQRASQLLSILLGEPVAANTYNDEGKNNSQPGGNSVSVKA